VIAATAHRLYFNALLGQKNYDKFFVLASSIAHTVKNYQFSIVMRKMMDEVAFPRFKG